MKLKILQLSLLFLAVGSIAKAQISGCATPYNLVTNGNFSSGNTGFTSDLGLDCTCNSSTYCVGTQLTSKCSLWSAANFNDHTSGTGNFLIIDGHTTAAADVWKQNISVCAGVNYTFGFWARNIYSAVTYPFGVQFVVNGTVVTTSSNIQQGSWNYYSTTWNSGATSGAVTIALRQQSGGAYRDFGIDDIFFGFCNTPLTITANTTICKGQTLALEAGGSTTYQWSTGATTSSINVSPSTTTTYTVTGTLACFPRTATVVVTVSSNLVSNGDFSSGNTGFTSDLSLGSNCSCIANSYCVGTQLTSKCSSWSGSNFHDHTSGAGNFLIIDGSTTTAPDLWKQNVTVSSGVTYTFSFWLRSVYSEITYPFNVVWVINGTEIASSMDIPQGAWTQFSHTWSSGTSGSIPIAIRQQSAGDYRDFGIDDIFFGICSDDGFRQAAPGEESAIKIADDATVVYPSPSNGSFTIQLAGTQEQSVFVYNMTGNVVFEKPNTTQKTVKVDLNELPKGIYLVKVLSGNKQEVKKIIVQ